MAPKTLRGSHGMFSGTIVFLDKNGLQKVLSYQWLGRRLKIRGEGVRGFIHCKSRLDEDGRD
ncbi:hypothetical protein SDJN02_06202 [Cucurbita argyrosperma subsp. argyrosperma]|nr:hypothetical protein SDJN02_06202 [Cucurbita argyrosperma subsp. argyrosperma]